MLCEAFVLSCLLSEFSPVEIHKTVKNDNSHSDSDMKIHKEAIAGHLGRRINGTFERVQFEELRECPR